MASKNYFLLLFVFQLFNFFSVAASEISDTRLSKINSIITRFYGAGENLTDSDVRSAILKEISKYYSLEPESKPNLISREELNKIVRDKVQLKFPDSYKDLEKRAKQNAEKFYKAAKINDYLRVTYEKGNKSFTVEGYFFGYGAMEHSINVGGNLIAIFDLVPEDRAKFDEKFRELQKEQYIKRFIRDYYTRKNDYSLQLLTQEKEEIIKFNENAGYILAMGKWMTPKELAINLMDSLASQGAIAKVDPILKDSPLQDVKNSLADATQKDNNDNSVKKQDSTDSETKRIAEVRRKAEIDQQRIKTRFAGIDADQGYGNAIWWMKHADVNLLFEPIVNNPAQGDIETISIEKGPVEKVELHFFNNYFYKVKVTFRIATPEAMEILYRKIVETYGKTDQDKEEEKLAAEAAENQTEQQNSEQEKKEEEEPPIPEEILLTWTGTETIGTLHVKLTPDKKNYSSFVLIKENPKVVQEVTALLEKERKAKTEAELKKLLDEYGEFKIK